MNRQENSEAIEILFERLRLDFGPLSEKIILAMAECIGGLRLTFPDLKIMCRAERDRRIRAGFTGINHSELAERHGLKLRQIRRILHGK